MLNKYKILIIDDSALMRRMISDIISKDSQFEVMGSAEDGVKGLDLLIRNNGKIDIVLLDVNMPKMNGLEVLKMVKRYNLKCKVIMVSTLVKDGAEETILALENGAVDFVLKPSNDNSINLLKDFEKKLLQSVRVTAGIEVGEEKERPLDSDLRSKSKTDKIKSVNDECVKGNKLVAVACSTGGPKSLKEIIPLLPKDIDAPIVLVQHMPTGFTKSLADRLNELSEVTVKEAKEGDVLEKGHIYIAPGGRHMKVVNSGNNHSIRITDEPPRDGLRPCANIMYESLIDSGYDQIICVVLTGMGADGTIGIEQLSKNKNVYVISQDAQTCIVYGMPRAINNAGLADEVQPLQKIAAAITKKAGVLSNGR